MAVQNNVKPKPKLVSKLSCVLTDIIDDNILYKATLSRIVSVYTDSKMTKYDLLDVFLLDGSYLQCMDPSASSIIVVKSSNLVVSQLRIVPELEVELCRQTIGQNTFNKVGLSVFVAMFAHMREHCSECDIMSKILNSKNLATRLMEVDSVLHMTQVLVQSALKLAIEKVLTPECSEPRDESKPEQMSPESGSPSPQPQQLGPVFRINEESLPWMHVTRLNGICQLGWFTRDLVSFDEHVFYAVSPGNELYNTISGNNGNVEKGAVQIRVNARVFCSFYAAETIKRIVGSLMAK